MLNKFKRLNPGILVILISILLVFLFILFFLAKRSYHTKILPFQNIILKCKMNGAQLFPKNGGGIYSPVIVLPKIFKIKFGFLDGEFLDGGGILKKNFFIKKNKFGYQYNNSGTILIKPTYSPPWLKEHDPRGSLMLFLFPLDFDTRQNLWIDYFWMGGSGSLKSYDAHYRCEKVYK